MYPPSQLGIGYQEEDLPDQIRASYYDFGTGQWEEAIMNKLDPPTPTFVGFYYYSGDGWFCELQFPGENANWTITDGTTFGGVIGAVCLIVNDPDIDFDYIADQFADTYTVSGPISGTVTRESICVWRGTNLRLTNYGYQWKVNGNDKSGNQNTPVGSYAGGYTVS